MCRIGLHKTKIIYRTKIFNGGIDEKAGMYEKQGGKVIASLTHDSIKTQANHG
ncbi:uncharacterized protein G2W53_019774 [Senna tora]|uniref:Uncharacterized protein n=1 Tax=Senna tora TaxID=362788 RepID=A0A834TYS9_9FABA|nr:uncharacterized protein G2W53_019774 [Senna tora]